MPHTSCIITLHTTNPLPFQVRTVDRHRSTPRIHPEIVQMWPGHGDILILIPDSFRRIIKKPYTGSSSTSRLLKIVYGFFPTTDANLPTCSDSSQLLKTVYRFFPTTDANLPTCSDSAQLLKQFTDSSLQRMSIYQLIQILLNFWK